VIELAFQLVRITKLQIKRQSLKRKKQIRYLFNDINIPELKCVNCPAVLRHFEFAIAHSKGEHPTNYYCVKCAVKLKLPVLIPKRILEYEGVIF